MPQENIKDELLKLSGVSLVFPGVKALSEVELTLRQGEIHSLMGQNGAGKSSLIKVITGVYTPSSGKFWFDGKTVRPSTPAEAQKIGISTVYQEVNLCPNLSVAENIYIGREERRFGFIDSGKMVKNARTLLTEKLNLNIDPRKTLNSYPIAIQQMVAIARALSVESKLLILDEPTSSLDAGEVQELFKVMKKLKESGLSILFVTHFLDQVYQISDRITVLRNGTYVGEYLTEELPKLKLISQMIGKEITEKEAEGLVQDQTDSEDQKDVFLQFQGYGKKGKMNPFDIQLRKGEVLGLAGLLGSGRTETAQLMFGLVKPDQGDVVSHGVKVNLASPRVALKTKLAYCPENRKAEGVIEDLSIRENMILALQASLGLFKTISRKKQEEMADKYIRMLGIKTPSSSQLIKNLSGGNQQKVILARWLLTNPDLLILDEPTRGIDVGAKGEIEKIIQKLKDDGLSILFISSDLEEVVRNSQRVAVLKDREKIAELKGTDINQDNIIRTIAQGGSHANK